MTEDTILESALALGSLQERHRFLQMICGEDDVLLARLQKRLQEIEQARMPEQSGRNTTAGALPEKTLVISPAEAEASGNAEDTIDTSFLDASSRPGAMGRLGHYEVLKVLGQGAFGTVFLAFDEKLHRHIAIKTMHPQLAVSSPPRKRFLKEARAVAAMSHENIVTIFAVEELPVPYLAMELISGQTLQEKLRNSGPMEVSEILHIGRQIAAGLAAAHAKNLIHRDIKPGNILLEDTADQKVKLTDFGLARTMDDASASRSGGGIAGTPMYMSPEQALGRTVDFRSDLFSLGSVLYEMASGRAPFRAASAVAVLKRVAYDTPRAISEIIPETPSWLCLIIEQLQAKNPEDRFQTAQEVVDLFARCQMQMATNSVITLNSREPSDGTPATETSFGQRANLWPMLSIVSLIVATLTLWFRDAGTRAPAGMTSEPIAGPVIVAPVIPEKEAPEIVSRQSGIVTSEADRRAADWAIRAGAELVIESENERIRVPAGESISLDQLSFQVLEIRRPQTVNWETEELDCLNGLQELQVLDLFEGRPGKAAMGNIGKVGSLRHLFLQRCFLENSLVEQLARLGRLKTLNVADNGLTDDAFETIRQLHTLETLWIGNNLIRGTRFTELSAIADLSHLDLTGLWLESGWAQQLRTSMRLSVLNLHACNVSDNDVQELVSTHDLSKLILNFTPVTDRVINCLLAETTLRDPGLLSTSISETGLKRLTSDYSARGGPVPQYDQGIPDRLATALMTGTWSRIELASRTLAAGIDSVTPPEEESRQSPSTPNGAPGTMQDGRLTLGKNEWCSFENPQARNIVVRAKFRIIREDSAPLTSPRQACFRLRDSVSGAKLLSIHDSGYSFISNGIWKDGRATLDAFVSTLQSSSRLSSVNTVTMAVFDDRTFFWCNGRFLVSQVQTNSGAGRIGLGWLDSVTQMEVEELEYQVLD